MIMMNEEKMNVIINGEKMVKKLVMMMGRVLTFSLLGGPPHYRCHQWELCGRGGEVKRLPSAAVQPAVEAIKQRGPYHSCCISTSSSSIGIIDIDIIGIDIGIGICIICIDIIGIGIIGISTGWC